MNTRYFGNLGVVLLTRANLLRRNLPRRRLYMRICVY
jgi:hypothetical protein